MNATFDRFKAAPSANGKPATIPPGVGGDPASPDATSRNSVLSAVGNGTGEGAHSRGVPTSSTPPADPPSPYDERDAAGRFAPGNKGGPGNPYARQSALLKRVFLEEGEPRRIRRIARKLLDLAEQGNVQAAKIVCNYCLGKPTPAVDADRVDLDELSCFKEASDRSEDRLDYWLPELELTLEGLRVAREQCTERTRKMTAAALLMPVEQAQRINKLPEKEREEKLLAAYDRMKQKREKEAAREAARREREAAREAARLAREASRLARQASRTPPDPFCNAAQVCVAGKTAG